MKTKTMKTRSMIVSALMALGIVSQASATNMVYLTGSTAFRATVYQALHNPGFIFDTNTTVQEAEYGGSSQSGANYMLFLGDISGTPTYINCAWSGSEAGIGSACGVTVQNTDRNGNPIALAGSPETWLTNTVPLTGWNGGTAPTAAQEEGASHIADLAQADTSQAVSQTPRVPNTATDLQDYGVEGIVTFTWAKNYQSTIPATEIGQEYTDLKNITIPQAYEEIAQGYQYTGFFTGVASETNAYVYLVGRNKGSGTRANTLADTGYGTTTAVQQFSIGLGIEETPQENVLILTNEANNGYESGGGVAQALSQDGSLSQDDPFFYPIGELNHTGWMAIGYLGTSDATSHSLTTNQWLTLDGVFESNAAIENGQYSFWGHEHLYGRHGITGYQATVGSKVFSGVQGYLAAQGYGKVPGGIDPGIALQYMNATKVSDVSFPTHN